MFVGLLHVLGAVTLGFYVLLPVLASRLGSLSGQALEGYAGGLRTGNRIGQYLLVFQLLTGGYWMSQGDYAVAWMIMVVVVLLALFAVSGIMGKPLRLLSDAAKAGGNAGPHIGKVKVLSTVTALLILAMVVIMYYPMYA